MSIPTIISFLSLSVTVCCQYHERNLINRLNEFFRFDHNIFLLDSLNEHNRDIPANIDTVTPQTIYIFDRIMDLTNNGSQFTTLNAEKSKNSFLIVVAKSFEFENSTQLLMEVNSIYRLDVMAKIGVFFYSNHTSMNVIQQLFRWSWSVGIVHIFCSFYSYAEDSASSFNVYRSDHFNTFDLVNVTGSESLQNYFPNKIPNYHNHPLRFLGIHDFVLSNVENNFWDTVTRIFNASTSTNYLSQVDYVELLELKEDIIVHETILDVEDILQIYPHRMTKTVLLVPHARPYSSFLAYLQINATWKHLFAYSLITISVSSILLTVSAYLQTMKLSLFKCVGDIINLLMNDNGSIKYEQLHRADVWIIVPFTFTGLIVVNGILSIFQSYITVPIYQRQIDTIDDLFECPFPILAPEIRWYDRTIEVLENISHHGGWSDRVRPMNISQLQKEIESFNDTIAFSDYDYKAQVWLEVQKRLSLNAYHLITETYLERFYTSFYLREDFPFMEPISDIIHSLQSAGLIEKWLTDGSQEGIKDLWKGNRNLQLNTGDGTDNGEFNIPTIVWCGWIISVVLFVCEMIWNKMKPKVTANLGKLKGKLSMD